MKWTAFIRAISPVTQQPISNLRREAAANLEREKEKQEKEIAGEELVITEKKRQVRLQD